MNKEDKIARVVARIGGIIFVFVFVFVLLAQFTGSSALQLAKDTLNVILQIIGIK